MKIKLLIILFLVFLTTYFKCVAAEQEERKTLFFGVLSFRPKEITMAQWLPLAKELEQALPGYTVELLPMTYPELDKAAKEKQLDFVLTNPEHYILLKNSLAMNAVATLLSLDKGHPTEEFAGVIFTRADKTDIQSLSDLNGKIIASPAEHSLGGYLMQRWELEKNNIIPKKYIFTGMPHDLVIDEVLTGKVDAGFIRSGVLENLEKEGKITLGEQATLRVVALHNANNNVSNTKDKIFSLHSTEHYPEWSFNIGNHISLDIIHRVSLALLNIRPDSDIAKAAGIAGFNPPANYTSVEVLMLRLRDHPDELKYFNFSDVLWRYREFAVITAFSVLCIFVLTLFLITINRKSKKLHYENKKLLLAIDQSPAAIFITDLKGDIQYTNQTFTKTTGYSLSEVVGKNPRVLKSGKTPAVSYLEMWKALLENKSWKGEFINCRKDGSEYVALSTLVPMKEANNIVSHYLAVEEDITERKKAEKEIQQLAFYDPLTGLPNRRKLLDRLHYSIHLSHRERRKLAVFMIDLDKFKAVNDTLGHAAGDELLKKVGMKITQRLRDSDMVARLGGDEFVIVLENYHLPNDAKKVALDIISDLSIPFTLLDQEVVQIGASIGISFYPQHGTTPEKLMDNADMALYHAKHNGRGCFCCYE